MARLGSFAASVDLPEHLRPWSAAGLEALFLPGGLPAPACCVQPSHDIQPSPDIQPGPGASAHADIHAHAPRQGPASQCAAPAGLAAATDVDWPEPWRAIAARVRTKPQIIITYASLTADVTGKADPARRKLFQSILAYMGWPQGSSLFWPCTEVPGSTTAPGQARNVFLNGVLSFGVTHIACFGDQAARFGAALFPPGPGEAEIRVLALPAPEELIGLLPHELHRALAALKALPIP